MEKCYLVLQNGRVFEGKPIGRRGETTAELVFDTAVVGFVEALTDPDFYGQALVATFPLIGNYGVNYSDVESDGAKVKAIVMRECCDAPSNFRSEGKFEEFLEKEGVIGIYDVDTRAVTNILREEGTMNAAIVGELPSDMTELLKKIAAYKIENAAAAVSCAEKTVIPSKGETKRRVALWDFGVKNSIVQNLANRGAEVIKMPYSSTVADMLSLNADGIFLSDGPSDPNAEKELVEKIAELADKNLPIFGVGLGHQLLAMAMGATVSKLKHGHRGGNQPAKCYENGRVYITSQNHGYVVDGAPKNAEVSFVNVNDGTVEGLEYSDKPMISVQFHPEPVGGAIDTGWLFDRFFALMEERKCR